MVFLYTNHCSTGMLNEVLRAENAGLISMSSGTHVSQPFVATATHSIWSTQHFKYVLYLHSNYGMDQ